jgi:Transposase DDE domain
MRQAQCTLSAKEVQAHVVALLEHFLRLPDYSARCTAATVWLVLCAAAAKLSSIFAICQHLAHTPSDETIRQALLATLPDYAELQRRVNRALQGDLPKTLRRRRARLAIDVTLIPYHGLPFEKVQEIYRGQAKSGTSHFHAYASAYVVCRGQRFTVALTALEYGESMAVVVQRLLGLARKAGVRPRLLLLDRGFYSVEVIRYLQAARVPFLMPAVARGGKAPKGPPATGIRAFQLLKRGGWGRHTLRNAAKRSATVSVCVYAGNYRGQWKRHGRFAWVYAYWGFQPGSPRWVADTYRQRFGIETSYRQMHQGRIRTSTRNPRLRYLFVALALLLRNVWVWLHWEVLSSPRRGQRRLNPERCRLDHLLTVLLHVAESLFGFDDDLITERPLNSKLKAA